MEMSLKIKFTSIFCVFWMVGFSQNPTYKYAREITNITQDWNKIVLPNDIFSKLNNNLHGFKILPTYTQKDSFEAPYILQVDSQKEIKTAIPFSLINQSSNTKGFFYSFENIANNNINQIQLTCGVSNFDCTITVEGSNNSQDWFTILTNYRILSIQNNNTNFSYTTVNFPSSNYKYFKITTPYNKNPKITAAKIFMQSTIKGSFNKYAIAAQTTKENIQSKQTIINIYLQQPVPISKVIVAPKNKFDYFRPITIKYIVDSTKTENGWLFNSNILTTSVLNSFEKPTFTFSTTIAKQVQIIIDNYNNEPLQFDSIYIEGPVHQLIARLNSGTSYTLTYGYNNTIHPIYDIEHFTNKIPTILNEVELGNEKIIPQNIAIASTPLFSNKAWLWALIILVIIVLGWFTLKMLRQQ
jgi:hypothetical protein